MEEEKLGDRIPTEEEKKQEEKQSGDKISTKEGGEWQKEGRGKGVEKPGDRIPTEKQQELPTKETYIENEEEE